VQVCPTGIDIRKGLQYECIGCAACVDACNSVMDKIGAARGLIRYWTDHAMRYRWSTEQILRHTFRPRVIIYGLVLLVIASVFAGAILTRTPLKMDVIRDRGSMGREIADGMIENVYRLQIVNTEESAHRYRISVSGLEGIDLQGSSDIALAPTESRGVPVNIRIPAGVGDKGSNKIFITITDAENPDVQVSEKAVFYVPR
jgi:cytochrome c oxidase accessory protein FixG